jgi:uncharacterized protein YfiM (DUF2279 family)
MRLLAASLLILLTTGTSLNAQHKSDSSQINGKRLGAVIIGTGVAYGASLVALNNAWYKEQRSSFHFFNDNAQWNQVDKLGHSYSAYQLSRFGKQLFLWTNMPEKKSAIWGTVLSQLFMTPIDVFDGFSAEYGFSWGDIAANMLGAGFFLSQELIYGEQKIKLKYSFHFTEYPDIRPEVLGSTSLEEILKDYNGHTYWLSFDLHSIFNHNPKIPGWINLACGYGAEGMVYGSETENNLFGYESYRQYYLGIDLDLSHIKTKSKLLKTVIFVADMIKLPAPAVEFNKHGTHFHWLYF